MDGITIRCLFVARIALKMLINVDLYCFCRRTVRAVHPKHLIFIEISDAGDVWVVFIVSLSDRESLNKQSQHTQIV